MSSPPQSLKRPSEDRDLGPVPRRNPRRPQGPRALHSTQSSLAPSPVAIMDEDAVDFDAMYDIGPPQTQASNVPPPPTSSPPPTPAIPAPEALIYDILNSTHGGDTSVNPNSSLAAPDTVAASMHAPRANASPRRQRAPSTPMPQDGRPPQPPALDPAVLRKFGHLSAQLLPNFQDRRDASIWAFDHFNDPAATPLTPRLPGGFTELPAFEQLARDEEDGRTRRIANNNILHNGQWRFRLSSEVPLAFNDEQAKTMIQSEFSLQLETFYRTEHNLPDDEIDTLLVALTVDLQIRPQKLAILTLPTTTPSLQSFSPLISGHPALYDGHGSMVPASLVTFHVDTVPANLNAEQFCHTFQDFLTHYKVGILTEVWSIYRNIPTASGGTRRLRLLEFVALVDVRESYNFNISVENPSAVLATLPGFLQVSNKLCELKFLWRFNYCMPCKSASAAERHTRRQCPKNACINCQTRGHTAENCPVDSLQSQRMTQRPRQGPSPMRPPPGTGW